MALSAGIIATIKRPNLIIANTVPLTSTQSNPPVELKNNMTGINQLYIHNLLDVVEINPANGYSLVYNTDNHKYEVGPISLGNSPIDGGVF